MTEDRAPYSRYAFGYPVPVSAGQGDLFNMSPWGPARMDQGGYPPESEPGVLGARWWRLAVLAADVTTVLRGCEAVLVDGDGTATCRAPGLLWNAPNGKSYVLCDVHLRVFQP